MEEKLREDGEAGGPTRQNVWTDPYDGLPVSDVFPGGPSDTTVLTSYPRHVARHINDSYERELITPVSNSGKLPCFKHEEWNAPWWEPALRATRFWGMAQTEYSFLDPGHLQSHIGIPSKGTSVDWMAELLGTTDKEAEDEIRFSNQTPPPLSSSVRTTAVSFSKAGGNEIASRLFFMKLYAYPI
ncbi:hypothetical protein QL285_064193 [Trifolium repens]|nr:hypothetical protein QL285_064193 [Trifolium repens]